MNIKRFLSYALIAAFIAVGGTSQTAVSATNAQSIQFLLSQVRNASGPLSGGKVYFYAAGATTTPKTVWSTRGKTVEAANPYTLDSLGTAQLYGDGLYRIVITTSTGITVYDRDYISIKDVSTLAYDVADYASLAAAISAIGSTTATLQYSSDQTLSANLTVPANIELMPINGAVINQGAYTVTYNGSISRWPLSQIFSGTGPVVGLDHIYPDWLVNNVTPGTTDMTGAIQRSLDSKSPVRLAARKYKVTSTLNFYPDSHLQGVNKDSGWTTATVGPKTEIIFAPSSVQNLFNLYTNTAESYMYRIYIGGIIIRGNTTGGGTNAQYCIYGRHANSVFEHLLIEKFQVGVYTQFTMLNKYRDIRILNMSECGIKTSDSDNTSQAFDDVYVGYSPWGAVLKNALGWSFTNCRWESLSTGGVDLYRGTIVDFIGGYSEDVPNTIAGASYGMFYIAKNGASVDNTSIKIMGGKYDGSNGTAYGSFMSAGTLHTVSGVSDKVSIVGTHYGRFPVGLTVDSSLTASNTVFVSGTDVVSIGTPIVGDDTPAAQGHRVYGVVDTSSGNISNSVVRGTSVTSGTVKLYDPTYGYANQSARSSDFSNGSAQYISFPIGRPGMLHVTASNGAAVYESAIYSISTTAVTGLCVVTKLAGTTNTAITNTAGKLYVEPTGAGTESVTIGHNLGVTVRITALVVN